MSTAHRGSADPVVHHLRPLTTYSSPSRTIEVRMLRASEEATSGSVIAKPDRISPASSGSSHCFFCSSVPTRCSTSMFPVSGAAQFIASGASSGDQPDSSASGAYSRTDSPDSSGRNRFHRPRARASALSSSTTGGSSCGRPAAVAARRCSAYTGSAGSTRSAMNSCRRSSISVARALGAKSMALILSLGSRVCPTPPPVPPSTGPSSTPTGSAGGSPTGSAARRHRS